MKDKELVEKCLLTDEELAEDTAMIYNFHMDISGIKNLLWQECRKQVKQAIPIIRKAVAEEIETKQKILLKGLVDVASNLGMGSFRPSREDDGARPLRTRASEALKEAGYNYYECCGKDNMDGWFTEKEIGDRNMRRAGGRNGIFYDLC